MRKFPELFDALKTPSPSGIVGLNPMECQGMLNHTLAFVNPFFIGHSNADRMLSVWHIKMGPWFMHVV